MRAVGTDDVRHICRLHYREIIGDRTPAYLARTGEGGRLKDASTLSQEQFRKFQKRMPPFKPEKLLNIFGPIGIHPFLEFSLRKRLGKEKRRQPPVKKPMLQVGRLKVLQIIEAHGRQ